MEKSEEISVSVITSVIIGANSRRRNVPIVKLESLSKEV